METSASFMDWIMNKESGPFSRVDVYRILTLGTTGAKTLSGLGSPKVRNAFIVGIVAIVLVLYIVAIAGTQGIGPLQNNTTFTITPTSSIPPPTWDYQGLASAALNSSEARPYVTDAYYIFNTRYGVLPTGNGTRLFASYYVVKAQVVTGNWTTVQTVTLTGQRILNFTVEYTEPSTYDVTGMTVKNLTDQSSQGSFNATQKQIIGVALANSTVKADIAGMAYYVSFVNSQINGTGYWFQISQVNGYRILEGFVNSELTEVTQVAVSTSYPNLGAPE